MTLADWHNNEFNQKALAEFLATPQGKAFMQLLWEAAPLLNRGPVDSVQALSDLGRLNHHHIILNLITAASQPKPEGPAEVRPDYSTPAGPQLK